MFVAMSRFVVANGMEEQVKQAFIERPRKVEDAPGYLRMDVMTPDTAPEEFWLMTYWQSRADWEQWYHGAHYKQSHKGIPKGLRLDPKATEIKYFNLVTQ